MPAIRRLCDLTGCRAYTRLSLRSMEKVAAEQLRLTTEQYIGGSHWGMKSVHASACGKVKPVTPLWLLDVDAITADTERLCRLLVEANLLRARIPSKKGEHLIVFPFDYRSWVSKTDGWSAWGAIELHKDNPTNLYIPVGAT